MILFLAACSEPPADWEMYGTGDPLTPGPILGGGLAVGEDGTSWMSDPDRSSLLRIAIDRSARAIALPVGSVPHRVAIAGDVVVVALRGAGAVALVETGDLSMRVVPVCAEPRGVDAAGDGTAWVACADGVLVHLDPAEASVLATLPVEDDLRDVVDDGGDTLWVSRFRTAEVLRVDRVTGAIVARHQPAAIDADTMPVSSDVDPYTPSTAWRMRRHPDGGVVMLHQMGATGALAEGPSGAPPAYYGGCQGIVVTTVTTVDPGGIVASSVPFDLPAPAIDLDIGPDGAVALALLGNEDVSQPIAVRILDPFAETDNCVQPVTLPGFVGTDAAHATAIVNGPYGIAVAHTAPFGLNGQAVGMREDTPYDLGWDTFHRATVSRASCVGCHPEGHEDGRTWRFVKEGVRRTQDVAGVSETAPFHWGGELATLDDLMHEVHEVRMGAVGDVAPSVTAALGAFLDRVPPYRAPSSPTPDLVATGAGLFVSSGCDECHTEPLPTENQDVGSGGSFQVPRLAGVRYRVPLMHDGCAETIRERFDPACGGTDHRDGHLTEPEIDALVAYLSTL
jgi:streptogramin lyase